MESKELKKQACHFCKEYHMESDLYETGKGNNICDDCSYDRCSKCLEGECEVETAAGDYICVDCYSGMIDDAYERCRD